jgi:hypothetical protein
MSTTKIKKARTIKDIQNHPLMVKTNTGSAQFWTEEDSDEDRGFSYWGFIISGYQVYGNEQHTIHEPTIERFCSVLNEAEVWEDDPELND